ncbi:putative YhbY family RNA-binding protein [Azonexus fungiphilus]|uniref:Putative YhbY family RNA-binding protein n=1 Tax=Azonexus fungiphilus TaxID=146940 RepID=A0A495WCM9_9RHOO|nr:ribosome assembly RNA-binding protein YhbY [Azonexus fungiphilus]NHC06125.1 ribosome assembly RNA-binding protein YhbY [Azonexus fungiphilus]RKT59451.1 putative YhbY family RNA-binding protein [Azonexus fungiphilus]
MQQLTSAQVRELRARAHGLNPVVSIAENGLSDAVLKEIDVCLKAHELIKIRVYGDSREDRLAYYERICQELAAAPVQHIGKLLVVYRENPEKLTVDRNNSQKTRAAAPRRTKRSFQG